VLGAYLRDESARAHPVTPTRLPTMPAGPAPAVRRLPTLKTALEAQVARRPDDARLRAELAQVLEATQAFDAREHADAVNAERAAADAGRAGRPDARLELLAARLQRDENLRRRHLETALGVAPDLIEARLLLARAELSQGHPERVLSLLQPLVQRWKAFVPAQVLLARAEDDLGDSVSATQRIEGLPPSTWRVPDAGRERVRSARRLDRSDEALERLRGMLEVRPGDGAACRCSPRCGPTRGRDRCRGRAPQGAGCRPPATRSASASPSSWPPTGGWTRGSPSSPRPRRSAPTSRRSSRGGRALLYAGQKDAPSRRWSARWCSAPEPGPA
jgi:hypothetical protein